ncbi:transposable element Tc1 transposase [Trichonephila clavata]|uniref:Transposable element Tc1 transposase n=1 Tax=Trichonephila clavata TaxID=2740835 RepID=A0A8X6KVK0_TRICU|nr:transposable element Tc1 transposase [Trichonephila clavata]
MNWEKNIDIQFSKVYEKAERLFKVDQEIKEIINFTDEEYDTMESYRDRFTEIRVIYEKNYNKHDESKSEISSEIAPDNLKLPKLSLKDFDLRVLETLNVTTSNYAAMLYPVVESCLPAEVLKAWDRHRLNREISKDLALGKEKVLKNLMTFLRHGSRGGRILWFQQKMRLGLV